MHSLSVVVIIQSSVQLFLFFFFSSRRRHTRLQGDWSSDVCSSDLTKWPVLHYGDVPKVDTSTWTFEVSGLVDRPFALTYDELLQLPRKTVHCDIHCVTRWSRLDNTFEGVAVQLLLERAGVKPDAQYCLVSAEQGFTTNLPLADLDLPAHLIAFRRNGEWLTPEHGGPAPLLGPHPYFLD